MMRVVDARPGRDELAASGLSERDFRIDPPAYRYFVEQYRRDFLAFERTFPGNAPGAVGATDPGPDGGGLTAPDEDCIDAFDRVRPPYHYRLGSIYRYRIDRTGPAEHPIILESLERSEVTGSFLGLPFTSQRQGLLIRFCLWIENRLQRRDKSKS